MRPESIPVWLPEGQGKVTVKAYGYKSVTEDIVVGGPEGKRKEKVVVKLSQPTEGWK